MAKCRAIRLSAEETIPSTHFSARPGQENTFLVPCSLTWNQPLSVSQRKKSFSHNSKLILQCKNTSSRPCNGTSSVDFDSSSKTFRILGVRVLLSVVLCLHCG